MKQVQVTVLTFQPPCRNSQLPPFFLVPVPDVPDRFWIFGTFRSGITGVGAIPENFRLATLLRTKESGRFPFLLEAAKKIVMELNELHREGLIKWFEHGSQIIVGEEEEEIIYEPT